MLAIQRSRLKIPKSFCENPQCRPIQTSFWAIYYALDDFYERFSPERSSRQLACQFARFLSLNLATLTVEIPSWRE